MAVSARFEADFSSFLTAVDQAEVKLVDFQSGAGRVEASLSRMVDNFSGRKVIQDATLMAEAVDRVGGASQLTETELGRVGAKAQEAADKLRAMGQDVPPKIQDIASAFHDLSAGGQEAKSWVEELGASFVAHVAEGILLRDVIRDIISVGTEAFEKAARFDDLARATGLSIDAIQRFSFVGKEFGVDAELMARGVEQLSAKLAGGDQNAVKAVQMLGLNVKDLIAAGPKDAFLEISDAAGRVEDPMLKNALAADLFGGKLAKILIPALGELRQKMDDIPKGAILTDQNVVNAHDLEVSYGHLKDIWGNVFVDLIVRTAEAFGGQAVKTKDAKDAIEAHSGADIELISTSQALENRLKALRTEAIEPLTERQKASIIELKSYGESQKDIAQLVGASEGAVHKFVDVQKEAEEAAKKAADEAARSAKAYADAMTRLDAVGTTWKDTLSGINSGLVEDVKQMLLAGASAKDIEVAWGILPPILKAVEDSIKADTEAVKKQKDAVLEVTKLWDEYSEIVATGNETAYERAQNAIDKWYDDLIAKNQKAKTDTTEFYDAIAALDDKKYQRLEANRLADDTRTREHLVRLATVAQEEYDFMLAHSSSFTADQINKQRDVADAAQLAAATWGTGFVQAAATVAGAIKGIPPVAKAAIDALRSFSIDPSTLSPEIGGTQGAPGSFQYEAWQQLRGIFTNNLPPAARAGGGPVDAGMSYLVGEQGPELFTPSSSGSISPNGAGAMAITIHVTQPLGTPQAIADAVSSALMQKLRGQGMRIGSGA